MSRTPGYAITVKLFIPAPKSDFKAQAAAASLADAMVRERIIPEELMKFATITGVDGRFSSMEQPVLDLDGNAPGNVAPSNGEELGSETQTDETAVEGVRKAGRSRG